MRYPGGIHLAGRYVGDVVPERDGDVLGGLVGPAQVDGDGLGDDHRGQDPGRRRRAGGGGAAAPLPVKEGVGRDDDRRRRLGDAGVGGAHLQGGQGGLARKDLDPFDADRLEAGLLGRQDADGVGAGLGVVLVQGQAGGRGVDLDVGGGAVRPGHPADGKTVPCDGDADPCHGGGLPGGVALDA